LIAAADDQPSPALAPEPMATHHLVVLLRYQRPTAQCK